MFENDESGFFPKLKQKSKMIQIHNVVRPESPTLFYEKRKETIAC